MKESVKKTGADITIAVMSGPFLQRGEPAIVDKWTRTEAALTAGIDIVLELPYVFAVQPADRFADGAVSILESCGVTDICFGSESGEITQFQATAEWLDTHGKQIDTTISNHLKTGKSYPRSYSEAVNEALTNNMKLDTAQPNNVLGLEYIKAVRRRSNRIRAHTVKRIDSSFHDEEPTSEAIASATALRKMIFAEDQPLTNIQPFVPHDVYQLLSKKKSELSDWEAYYPLLKYNLITSSAAELKRIYDCSEGLEYRLKKMVHQAETFEEFIAKLKTKRYTRTKLQRLTVHTLNRVQTSELADWAPGNPPPYIRLLGMNARGQAHLSAIKKTLSVPLITKASAGKHPWHDIDLKAAHIADFIQSNDSLKEFQKKPVIID